MYSQCPLWVSIAFAGLKRPALKWLRNAELFIGHTRVSSAGCVYTVLDVLGLAPLAWQTEIRL